jgi:(p)ppGpp synthase/HD superfamily hydrolase
MIADNTWNVDALQDAWQLATQKHDGQKYGGFEEGSQVEYLNHIGSVTFEIMTASVMEKNMDVMLAITCAMLHDTIEDTDLSYESIVSKYGARVANGVLALTKDKKIEGKKEKMIDSLRRIKKQPKEIWSVKMSDRIANLYAPPFYWNDEKKKVYIEEAWLILKELGVASKYLADRLADKINAYK